MKTVGFTEYTN